MVGKIQCCLVINFYTYHVDTNKDSQKKKKDKEGYVFPQKNQFYYSSQLHYFFFKDYFVGYVYASFQFSKHGRYAQKYAYQIFKYIV